MERPGKDHRRDMRGSMLIVAMGILALMSIMAVTFARLMRLESVASTNYVDMIRAKQLAESGLARAVVEVRHSSSKNHHDSINDPWVFKNKEGELALGTTIEEAQRFSVSGTLGATYPPGADEYRVKAIDCASQINLNGKQITLAAMLDHLGEAIAEKRKVRNPIERLGYYGASKGQAIINFRNSLMGGRFSSKMQLLELFQESERKRRTPDADMVGLEKFNLFKDYVTAHSWVNQKTVRGLYNKDPKIPTYYQAESRAPININTASEGVLIACLRGVGGRGRYVVPKIDVSKTVDAGTEYAGRLPTEEEKSITEQVKFIYVWPLNRRQAGEIAALIVKQRRNKPFKSFADFEYFVDKEIPSSSVPTYPARQPDDDRNFPHFKAWYEQAGRDMIKANFNPNARPNYHNPGKGVRLIVDKANLWKMDEQRMLKEAYTTEFCFSSMGYFEIVSLGRVLDPNGEVVAESKLRSVVKIFDTIMHTSQREFELAEGDYKLDITSYPLNVRAFDEEGDKLIGYFEIYPIEDAPCVEQAKLGKLLDVRFDQEKYHQAGQTKELAIAYGDKNTAVNEKPDTLSDAPRFGSSIKFGLMPKDSDVLPDGFYTSKFKGRYLPRLRYRAAAASPGAPSNTKTKGIAQGEVNVPMYSGAIEFWIKPEFDSEAKVFSGFLAVTTFTSRTCGPRDDQREYKGGTQMFFFMNTQGKLRLSRMYYEAFFDSSGRLFPLEPPYPGDFDTSNPLAYPPYEKDRPYNPDPPTKPNREYEIGRPLPNNDTLDNADKLSPRFARTDIVVDTDIWGGWKAGEWHHVVIAWDDESDSSDMSQGICCLRLAVDGRWLPGEVFQYAQDKFVLLNEIGPGDCVYLGGIFRRQKYGPEGIFKFGGNDLALVANATIDNFVTYKQNNIRIKEPADRYPTSGIYGNFITIPFPPGVAKVKLRAVEYTAYAPTVYVAGHRGLTHLVNPLKPSETVAAALSRGVVPGVSVRLFPAGNSTATIAPGEVIKRDAKTGSARVGYEVRLKALSPKAGAANIASPVFDSVQISYFLPREDVLVFEKIVE